MAASAMETIMAHLIEAFTTAEPVEAILTISHATSRGALLARQRMLLAINDREFVTVRTIKLVRVTNLSLRSHRKIEFRG